MKKLLLSTLLLPILCFAQQDTIKIPAVVAKQIVKDLVVCDSIKAQLTLTQTELYLTQYKLVYKDTIIDAHKKIESNLKDQIGVEKLKTQDYMTLYDDCKKDYKALSRKNKILKFKSKLTSYVGSGLIIAISILYLIK
jgi:hypothetical protein